MVGVNTGNEGILTDEFLQMINASSKTERLPLDFIYSASPNDWVMAINNDIFNKSGKMRLAEACKKTPAFFHVAVRLLEQNAIGIALAREILEDENWAKYQEILEEHNIKESDTKEKMINALGRLLVSKKLIFWSLSIVFSKSAVRGFLSFFRDADSEVRRKALEAIETYDIELSEPALVMALDDSDKKVRTAALGALKKKLPESRLMSLLDQDLTQTRTLGNSAKRASEAFLSAGLNMPGVKQLLPYLRSFADGTATIVTDGAASVGSTVSTTASSVSTSLASAFKRLTRRDSPRPCESPEALFALYITLAWADGTLEENEKEALNDLIKNNTVDRDFQKWLDTKPDLRELAPFLKKLSNPQESFDETVKSLGIDVINLDDKSWIIFLEALLGIKGTSIHKED